MSVTDDPHEWPDRHVAAYGRVGSNVCISVDKDLVTDPYGPQDLGTAKEIRVISDHDRRSLIVGHTNRRIDSRIPPYN